ncbi:hypothetical protein AB205_0138430, partial [Aquarana catesbeiana]
GYNNGNPPERCPLHYRDSTQEDQDYQGEDLIVVKVEPEEDDPYVTGDEPCKEKEIPPEISTDGQHNLNHEEKPPVVSPGGETEDDVDLTSNSSQECSNTTDVHLLLNSTDLSLDPSNNVRCIPNHSSNIALCPPPVADQDLQCSECGTSPLPVGTLHLIGMAKENSREDSMAVERTDQDGTEWHPMWILNHSSAGLYLSYVLLQVLLLYLPTTIHLVGMTKKNNREDSMADERTAQDGTERHPIWLLNHSFSAGLYLSYVLLQVLLPPTCQ